MFLERLQKMAQKVEIRYKYFLGIATDQIKKCARLNPCFTYVLYMSWLPPLSII